MDGDADRVVFFQPDGAAGAVSVFDGDKIACLAALLVKELVAELPAQDHGFTVRWPPLRHPPFAREAACWLCWQDGLMAYTCHGLRLPQMMAPRTTRAVWLTNHGEVLLLV